MSVKSTALTVGMVIAAVIIAMFISYHPAERRADSLKRRPSDEQEKGSEPAKVEVKREDKIRPQPLVFGNREIEIKYSATTEEGAGSDREAEMSGQGGPPPKVASRPLPMFAPFHSDTGPLPQDSDKTATSNLPEAAEQPADPGSSPPRTPLTVEQPPESTERYVYGGPPVPIGKKTRALPPFTPITNKTGPVAIESDR